MMFMTFMMLITSWSSVLFLVVLFLVVLLLVILLPVALLPVSLTGPLSLFLSSSLASLNQAVDSCLAFVYGFFMSLTLLTGLRLDLCPIPTNLCKFPVLGLLTLCDESLNAYWEGQRWFAVHWFASLLPFASPLLGLFSFQHGSSLPGVHHAKYPSRSGVKVLH